MKVKKTCKNCGSKTCWAAGCMDWNGNEECWVKKEPKEVKQDYPEGEE